jgi:hypothetical protein
VQILTNVLAIAGGLYHSLIFKKRWYGMGMRF